MLQQNNDAYWNVGLQYQNFFESVKGKVDEDGGTIVVSATLATFEAIQKVVETAGAMNTSVSSIYAICIFHILNDDHFITCNTHILSQSMLLYTQSRSFTRLFSYSTAIHSLSLTRSLVFLQSY